MSERFLYTIWNRLPFRFRQRLKQNVKRNMQEQYAESEQELYRRTEQFLLKQGKIILTEVMIGGLLLAVVLAWHIFKPDYILLKRNPFGQGTKQVQISLQKGNKKKQIQYKLEEQKISLKERQKVYQAFFKQLKKEMRGRNPSLYKVSEALNLPESIAGYPFEITYTAEEETVSQEVQKERTTWKEIKEALQLLTKTGILFYVSDHPEQLSRKSISEENLPSRAKKREQEEHKVEEFLFSGLGLKGIKSMLSVDFSINTNSTLWTKENYIVPYIEECFLDYSEEEREEKEEKNDVQEQVLAYEKEYLIKGQPSDLDNLKRVANDIFLLRFINNYIFTGRDAEIQSQVNLMASALTGVVGIPQTAKAVQMMLRAALSYGESLLELHTLFEGGEISLTKDRGNWNLELKTMVKQLKEKKAVKKGKHNISYKDYLKVLLFMKENSTILCYRMMDIMQENIACKEAGFLMENCLFSYKWEGSLSFGTVKMKFEKQVSY